MGRIDNQGPAQNYSRVRLSPAQFQAYHRFPRLDHHDAFHCLLLPVETPALGASKPRQPLPQLRHLQTLASRQQLIAKIEQQIPVVRLRQIGQPERDRERVQLLAAPDQ
jgi:hypothetical protein